MMNERSILDIQVSQEWPRCPAPGHLWCELVTGSLSFVDVMRQWLDESTETPDQTDLFLVGIQHLANSILSVGLANPILVTADDILVSGLRRVLAHAYLVVQGRPEFTRIPAITVDRPLSRSQQLAEIVVRDDLTAVEKAINLGLLIAEIEEVRIEIDQPLFGFDSSVSMPIALRRLLTARRMHGTWGAVTDILGHTYRHWTNYARIFRLCDPALTIAHWARLSENALRDVVCEDLSCEEQVMWVRTLAAGKKPPKSTSRSNAPTVSETVKEVVSVCGDLSTFNLDTIRHTIDAALRELDTDSLEKQCEIFRTFYSVSRRILN